MQWQKYYCLNWFTNNGKSLETSYISTVLPSTARNVLELHKYHPYKINLVQEFMKDDFNRRLEDDRLFLEFTSVTKIRVSKSA